MRTKFLRRAAVVWLAAAGCGATMRAAESGAATAVATKAEASPASARHAAVKTVAELAEKIEAHVTRVAMAEALWGVKVVSLDTGRVWVEHGAHRMLSPASNCKLYAAALALDRLGADYRIVTPIFGSAKPEADGVLKGDVIVSGRGDPSWKARGTKADFWKTFEPFVVALARAGVKRITGDLVADATWIQGVPNGAGWTADDLNDDYGAEISALTLEDNYAELRVTPAARAGARCEVALLQPHTGLVIDNRTTTGAKGSKRQVQATRIFGENTVHLFGELPAGDKDEIVEVTVPRPAAWFAAALREALGRRGIHVEGGARSRRWPDATAVTATAVKLGEVTSPPLGELVKTFMKPSQNLETDLIFAHVGELTRNAATPARRTSEELGVEALQAFLKKNGLPADEVRFEEGSGLSRNNLASANATVALLTLMTKHAAAAEFADSLPVAGVDGSLRRRMKGTPAKGNVRAKTGSLRFANSLSGYVKTAAGEHLVFSLMANRVMTLPPGRGVRDELDDVAEWLAGFAGR